jgi:hypothetical protein
MENVEYPLRSPDLTPSFFFLWSTLNNAVYTSKPHTLQDLRHETEIPCAAIPLATIQNVCCMSLSKSIAAGGGYLEHLCL